MQTQRNAKQRGKVFQRSVILLCVLLLLFCVSIVFFLTAKTYASGSNTVRPADMSPTTVPTDPPTPVPTTVPTTAPTPVPTTAPTAVPTTAPTVQPTQPKPNPTAPPQPVPTATTIAGGLPPPANNPPQPTTGPTASPTPTAQKTATPVTASSTPAATTTVSSVISGATTTSTPSQQSANNAISLPQIASIGGGALLLSSALFLGLAWRQRRMQRSSGQASFAQRSGLYPRQGRTETEPLYQALQPLMSQPVPEMALAASTPNSAPMRYAQATQVNMSPLPEATPTYSEASPVPMEELQVAETPSQAPDSLLEAMMRQAQIGLFALPNKTE